MFDSPTLTFYDFYIQLNSPMKKKRKMMKMMKEDYMMMMKKMRRKKTMYTMRELSTQITMMLMQVNLTALYPMVGTRMEQSITMMITSCM